MRRFASITVAFCFLSFALFAFGQNQRVFVGTSFPAVSLPSQPGEHAILASQAVGLSMRQLWSFDVFAEGNLNMLPQDNWQGSIDVWVCDKSDCSGNLNANVGGLSRSQLGSFNNFAMSFHVSGTFAQTNPGHPSAAMLSGQLSYVLSYPPDPISDCPFSEGPCGADVATPQTPPIDLYTGNRYLALAITCNESPGCAVSPSDTLAITVFRINMLP